MGALEPVLHAYICSRAQRGAFRLERALGVIPSRQKIRDQSHLGSSPDAGQLYIHFWTNKNRRTRAESAQTTLLGQFFRRKEYIIIFDDPLPRQT